MKRASFNILHVEAGPTFGGSTGALESYLVYGDRERLARDVLFHHSVPGTDAIQKNSRRFICLGRRPSESWDSGDEANSSAQGGVPAPHGADGAPEGRAPATQNGKAASDQAEERRDSVGAAAASEDYEGAARVRAASRGPLRRTARRVPGARALASSVRGVARLIGVELPLAMRVAYEARKGRCDLIHSNNTPTIQRSTLIASALVRKPAVCHVRTAVRLGWLDRRLAGRCRLVIAQSSSIKDELEAQGLRAPIVYCFDGVTIPSEPYPVSNDVKGELLGTGDTVVGGIGRLVDRKGFRYLIEAMPELTGRHPKLTLALVGDGPQRQELEDLAACLGVGQKVRFLGFRRDLRYVLQAIDIYALPSLREGLPLTLLIAMAEGRPAVASAVDGIPTFVHHGRTGLLVQPRDSGKLAEALLRLLDDRSLATQLGRAGRSLVAREASVRKTAARVDELLLGVLEGRAHH